MSLASGHEPAVLKVGTERVLFNNDYMYFTLVFLSIDFFSLS